MHLPRAAQKRRARNGRGGKEQLRCHSKNRGWSGAGGLQVVEGQCGRIRNSKSWLVRCPRDWDKVLHICGKPLRWAIWGNGGLELAAAFHGFEHGDLVGVLDV